VKKEEKKPVEGQKKIAELLRVGPPQTDQKCYVHCFDFTNLCGNGMLGFISNLFESFHNEFDLFLYHSIGPLMFYKTSFLA